MNKDRRKALQEIRDKLSTLQEDLESILDQENESRDNMPESLQCSERYETSEEASGNIEEAIDQIGCACDSIDEAISC